MGVNQRGQIEMTPEEITAFVASKRTANLATLGASALIYIIVRWM